jgi:hypothetical protein
MFISNYHYQNYYRHPTESDLPLFEMLPLESEAIGKQASKDDTQRDDVNTNYTQENGFFKGCLYALPACILFWAFIAWAV